VHKNKACYDDGEPFLMTHPNDPRKIPYRPYIDGLRGIAVIAVVFYHAKLFAASGGFIGVDVFFVISGFLISAIIVRDIAANTFSLSGFWERRIRRILPALFVVMSASIVAAYFLLLYPEDYRHFGKAVLAQSLFASNMFFMLSDNYFDQHARLSPILHTWSLSVEEQFYILFPFVVLLFAKLSPRALLAHRKQRGYAYFLAAVAALGFLSLILNIWFVDVAPSSPFTIPPLPGRLFWGTTYATAGFYILATRAWELALGILLSLSAFKLQSVRLAEITSFSGIAAITASIFLFNDTTAFPGFAALLPTLGAAAIIIANESHPTKTGALLSSRLLVATGLISYSLYLWHWPLFVFAGLATSSVLSKSTMLGLIAIAVALSWLTYKFIEIPFRKKILVPKRNTIFLLGFAAMVALACSGFLIERSASVFSRRIPTPAKNILLALDESVPWGGECFQRAGDGSLYGGLCRIGNSSSTARERFVVWGDSHADALSPLFHVLGTAYGAQGVVFDGGNCLPVAGVHQTPKAVGCEEENAFALKYIKENHIMHVILVARWNYYITGGQQRKPAALISDSKELSTTPMEAQRALERNLIPMITQMSHDGRKVTIVLQAPEQFDFDTRDAFYRAVHKGEESRLDGIMTKDNESYQELFNAVSARIAQLPGVNIVDPATLLCEDGGRCNLKYEGKLLYRDESHLSTFGALRLEPLFTPLFYDMHLSSQVE